MAVERTVLPILRYGTLGFVGGILSGAKVTALPAKPRGSPHMTHCSADKCGELINGPNDDAQKNRSSTKA